MTLNNCTIKLLLFITTCCIAFSSLMLVTEYWKLELFSNYNTELIKKTLDDDLVDQMMSQHISDDNDMQDFDVVGIYDAPLYAPADDVNIFLLNQSNVSFQDNIAYIEPSVDELRE